ncbi:MAG: D-alanyl-D-alanine carboxypeptidase family protein [Dehalococcoidia bacterium]|nr:D-alanyl-D-alanine carboxypeptidase family protein [Dehalococcoidia bacterium]
MTSRTNRLATVLVALACGLVLLGCTRIESAPAPDEAPASTSLAGTGSSMSAMTEAGDTPLPPGLQYVDPLAVAPTPVEGVPFPEISAGAGIVLDGDSLAVLWDRNAHERREPASVTKMVTAILAAENASMEAVFTSDVHHWALEWDSSTMGLEPGDQFTLRDLLLGLMLVSGNDAAIVIGRHIAGSDEAFVDAMNVLVGRLGLQDTHFMNAHGFSQPGHYSSAYDLALIARYLMSIPALREVVGTEQVTVTGTGAEGQERSFELYSHNPLLNYTPGVDGVKTGFTEGAGRTFAVTAERDGHRVYVVILDAPLRAEDSIALIEWAFAAHRWSD